MPIMKRILKIIFSVFIIALLPFSMLAGQEKKSKQKVKIIVSDGSGTKVVIDTLIKDGQEMKSFTLKDGNTVFIGHPGDEAGLDTEEGSKKIIVTVSTDGGDTKKEVREITIIKSDSAKWTVAEKDGKVIEKEGGETYFYTIKSDNKESDAERTKYVINKGGMVISIEGSDYTKVKELANEIESTIDAKNDVTEKKEVSKK